MELEPGTVVGGYRLGRLIASGAMGAVYLARHPNLPRDVALKILHPALSTHPEMRARFAAEAELLARLDDPGVVDVLDRGQDGDRLWMAMRYIDGPDLAQVLLERGAFSPVVAVDLVTAVGRALDHAHRAGLLHRDVKPANVLLKQEADGSERALLTDFGIAKDLAATHGLTQEGHSPATIAYAAPEQLSRGPLDARVDVYALAAVLFELVSGRRAFDADETPALIWSVVDGPVPDLRELRRDLPGLAAVLTRAMAKNPSQRPASCRELTDAARGTLATDGAARPQRTPAPITVHQPPVHDVAPPGPRQITREQVSGPPGPDGRGRHMAVVGGVLVAVAVVVAALVALVTSGTGAGSNAATDTSSGPVISGSAETPAESSAESTDASRTVEVAVGTCLADDGSTTACDGPHVSEVYAAGECSDTALLAYLGGVPGTDVLRTDVVLGQSGEECTVGLPDGALETASTDVLLGSDGDRWRRCSDALAREVPCSEPHIREVIYLPTGDGAALDCGNRASDYVGRPFSQVSTQLRLDDTDGCAIELRSDNVLTASLRRLGSGALPIG